MQFIEVRHSKLSEVSATKAEVTTSPRLSVLRRYGLLVILTAGGLLGFSTTWADTAGNPADEIRAQLCPMLDSLTQASVNMAKQDRATASTQIGLTISLADGLSSTVESPDIVGG